MPHQLNTYAGRTCRARAVEASWSAHDDAGVEALKAAAGQRIAAGQTELDPGLLTLIRLVRT